MPATLGSDGAEPLEEAVQGKSPAQQEKEKGTLEAFASRFDDMSDGEGEEEGAAEVQGAGVRAAARSEENGNWNGEPTYNGNWISGTIPEETITPLLEAIVMCHAKIGQSVDLHQQWLQALRRFETQAGKDPKGRMTIATFFYGSPLPEITLKIMAQYWKKTFDVNMRFKTACQVESRPHQSLLLDHMAPARLRIGEGFTVNDSMRAIDGKTGESTMVPYARILFCRAPPWLQEEAPVVISLRSRRRVRGVRGAAARH